MIRAQSPLQVLRALIRYGVAGSVVFLVYVSLTLLSVSAGVPIQAAIPVSYVLAVAVHFVLQRRFVFAGAQFALTTREQVKRYVALGAVQYPLTAIATAVLPGLLGLSEQLVYVGVTALVSAASFLVMRALVFHDGGA